MVELGQRRKGEDEEKEKEKEKATNIKSNNPHLAGGEIWLYGIERERNHSRGNTREGLATRRPRLNRKSVDQFQNLPGSISSYSSLCSL